MSKRPLPRYDLRAILAALGACRTAMIDLRAGSPPRSLPRAAADQMISNIDELAWMLTGDRDAFIAKGHSSLSQRNGGEHG